MTVLLWRGKLFSVHRCRSCTIVATALRQANRERLSPAIGPVQHVSWVKNKLCLDFCPGFSWLLIAWSAYAWIPETESFTSRQILFLHLVLSIVLSVATLRSSTSDNMSSACESALTRVSIQYLLSFSLCSKTISWYLTFAVDLSLESVVCSTMQLEVDVAKGRAISQGRVYSYLSLWSRSCYLGVFLRIVCWHFSLVASSVEPTLLMRVQIFLFSKKQLKILSECI